MAASLLSVASVHFAAMEAIMGEVRADLVRTAQAAAALVDAEQHKGLIERGREDCLEYEHAVAPLRRVLDSSGDVRYLYTVAMVGERVLFVLDATPEGDADEDGVEDHSFILEEYREADPAMRKALRQGEPVAMCEPRADRWGTLLSGYAPILDSEGGVAGIVGVDITAEHCAERIGAVHRAAAMGLLPAAALSLFAGLCAGAMRRAALRAALRARDQRAEAQREVAGSESRLRLIFDSAMDAVVASDARGVITAWNAQAERIFGWSAAEAVGRSLTETIVPPQHRAAHKRGLKRYLETGEEHVINRRVELTALCRDGSEIPIELSIVPVRGEEGVSFCAFLRDIRERARAEQEQRNSDEALAKVSEALRAASDEAHAAGRAASEFLTGMSQEIRPPLTTILGFADLLAAPGLSAEERVEHARAIRRSGERLLSIMGDVLDISKIEAGRMTIDAAECSPARLAEEACAQARGRAVEKGLSLAMEPEWPLPRIARLDAARVRQVLDRLLANAVVFTEKGGVTLRCRLSVADPRMARLRFEVEDTGPGMSDDTMRALFKPFAPCEPGGARTSTAGIGLAISRRLADMMGGEIEARSVRGEGSVLTLSLPVGPVESLTLTHEAPAVDERFGAVGAASLPLEGARILLAEDGPDNQRLISTFLMRAGAEVDVAVNGRIAVERAQASRDQDRPFDVILLDMRMPELDGFGAASALRRDGWRGPIIALTSDTAPGQREQCLEAGCDAYLTKPVTRERLITACVEWMGQERDTAPADSAH